MEVIIPFNTNTAYKNPAQFLSGKENLQQV